MQREKLRLLICTQKIDEGDSNLSFFLKWIEEFALVCESVVVICLFEGAHHLPPNVRVYSLGKEAGKKSRFAYAKIFLKLIREHRDEYDAVLVHMNPEYLILGGLSWRRWHKKIALWYVHKQSGLRLRIGAWLADVIFSASRESFRLRSKKLRVLGHGIDTSLFATLAHNRHDHLHIVTLGRISSTKRIVEMLQGIAVCRERGMNVRFTIIGAPITDADRAYAHEVDSAIQGLDLGDIVRLAGPIPYSRVPEVLADADVMLNFSRTGSMDKAVLDAFAAGVPVVTSNEAFASVPVALHIPDVDPASVADAIEHARESDREKLRSYVEQYHSLPRLVREIVRGLADVR